jgi:hypothetical protein
VRNWNSNAILRDRGADQHDEAADRLEPGDRFAQEDDAYDRRDDW